MNKKASWFEIDSLSKIILALIILVIVLGFVGQLVKYFSSIPQDNACKMSVYTHSKIGSKINCPTNYLEITKENEAFPAIANELYKCWDNFGRGNLELFANDDKKYCSICSSITFKGFTGQKQGLIKYLIDNPSPNAGFSYFESLYGIKFYNGNMETLKKEITDHDGVDFSKPVSIIFTYTKNINRFDKTTTGTVGAIGGGGVALAGGLYLTTEFVGALGATIFGIGLIPTVVPIAIGATAIATVVGSYLGGTIGYALGSETSTEWDAKVLAVPFDMENINKLECNEFPVQGENNVLTKTK